MRLPSMVYFWKWGRWSQIDGNEMIVVKCDDDGFMCVQFGSEWKVGNAVKWR